MAKDLPYFKFFCSEWNDGDITLETYEHQGLFINICSYYWSNECNLHFDKLIKRFRSCEELIDDLSAAGLFKIKQDRFISISFLDEQREERDEQSKKSSKAGIASAKARKLKKLQQETNISLTQIEHPLNFGSTETQPLREEEKRRDKKKEDNIINNSQFIKKCLDNKQWIEVIAMQNKIKIDVIKIFITTFENHLITMEEQKKSIKDFKVHFTNWLSKQNLSQFRVKKIGKTNQI